MSYKALTYIALVVLIVQVAVSSAQPTKTCCGTPSNQKTAPAGESRVKAVPKAAVSKAALSKAASVTGSKKPCPCPVCPLKTKAARDPKRCICSCQAPKSTGGRAAPAA